MQYLTDLDAVLQTIVNRWDIPGLAVGIVADRKIAYAKGFGVQSLQTRAPVTTESIFCVASVSKCFVATAVMQLAERGLVELDAPVTRYLPYFQLADARYEQITIRHILSHTSGMPDHSESEYDELVAHPEWDEGAAERYVRGLRNRKLLANPGQQFSYSNIGYNVLGDMISKVSGQSFEDYMREHIMKPAGMPNSTFLLSEVRLDSVALPHLRTPAMGVNPIYPYHRADAPASFLHSTVMDMCHWALTCMSARNPIISRATFARMCTPVVQRGDPPLYEDMGLGYGLGRYYGVKTVGHGGMGFGWSAFLVMLPANRRGAVILCNEESFSRSRILRAVLDTMLGLQPQAGKVSWMVPISQALAEGGIEAANARYDAIKTNSDYLLFEYDLLNLATQLVSAGKLDLAIGVLELNLRVFPQHADSYIDRARYLLLTGDAAQAETSVRKALAIEPDNAYALELLREIRAA